MSIRLSHDDRQNLILTAALGVFGRYGFKRTSMEDIAREAGISRASLYLSFENKSAIFMALALAMGEQACLAAEAAWPLSAGFAEGLTNAACALHGPIWRIVREMPHGRELVETDANVIGDVVVAMDKRFGALIMARSHGLVCSASGDDHQVFATMIVAALHGLKDGAATIDGLTRSIETFARLIARGAES
jgi:AcrR family transcriptional regulator